METIHKALDILEFFLLQEGEFSITEVADNTKLNVSTTYRMLSVLVKRGYIRQKARRGKYYRGSKLLEFASTLKISTGIREVSLPFLRELNNATGEAVNLAILDSNKALNIEHIMATHEYTLRMFTPVGTRNPLHCTGLGKVLLANMEQKELENSLGSKSLPRYTKHTITNFNRLQEELQVISQKGIAEDNEELEIGAKCIASAVKNSDGKVVAAVSIAAPAVRLNDTRVTRLRKLVKRCGLKISEALGYEGDRKSLGKLTKELEGELLTQVVK